MDVYLYKGTKGTTTAPEYNHIEIGGNYTLSNGDSGFLTYYAAESYQWNEGQDYLWPIPADQRQITGGALSQNPGWVDGITM